MKKILFILILLPHLLSGQNNSTLIKNWYSLGVKLPLSKDISIQSSYLSGFNTDPINLKFTEFANKIYYSPWDKIYFTVGYSKSVSIKKDLDNTSKNRYLGTFGIKSKWGVLHIQNAIKFEIHDPKEKRYDYRLIYILHIRTKSNLLIPKLKLSPFITAQIFYNIGGKAITQYDFDHNNLGKYKPEGFHRIRFKSGFSFKPFKILKLSFYGIYQEEFNTIWAFKNHRLINVIHPETGKVTRRFQNYIVLGASAKIYLPRIFKKKKDKSTIEHPNESDTF